MAQSLSSVPLFYNASHHWSGGSKTMGLFQASSPSAYVQTPSTGYMPTHKLFSIKEVLVDNVCLTFPTMTWPCMFEGGTLGIAKQVDVESQLCVQSTRISRAEDSDLLDAQPYFHQFTPLIVQWEQPNYRPIETLNTHFEVKLGDTYKY